MIVRESDESTVSFANLAQTLEPTNVLCVYVQDIFLREGWEAVVVVCDLSMSVIGGKIVDVLVPEKGTSLFNLRVSKPREEVTLEY